VLTSARASVVAVGAGGDAAFDLPAFAGVNRCSPTRGRVAGFLAFLVEALIVRRRVLPPRLRTKPLLGLVAAAFALARPAPALALSPYLIVPEPGVAEATPAYRYANMSDAEAFDELDRRKILYTKLESAPGVRAPVRLTGRLHGVYIHSSLPPDQRVTSIFEILDARLLLALDDFAAVLERHEIDEVIHFTMYRPNVAAPAHGVNDEPQAGKATGRARATHGKLSTVTPAKASPGKAPAGVAPGAPVKKAPLRKPAPSLGSKGMIEGGKGGHATASGAAQKPSEPEAPKPAVMVTQAGKKAPGRTAAPLPKGKGSAPMPAAAPAKPAPAAAPTKPASAAAPAKPASAAAPAKPAPSVTAKSAVGAKPHSHTVAHRDPAPSGLHKTTWAQPGTRHPAGLAIDVGLLHKKDGRWLSVARHFHGQIGNKTCGEGVRIPDNPDARELRALVCESADQGLFTYVLTPNYNAAHADHYHMEIRASVHWFLYH
jgi:hypothetical protein